MTLDPKTAEFLRTLAEQAPTPYEEMDSAEAARAAYREVVRLRGGGAAPQGPGCSVEEFLVDGLWYRAYRPLDVSVHDGPLPLVLFMHGGGWVLGDLDTHDAIARAFTRLPGIVLSVAYRLAPEHPYPAAHEDCWQALEYAASELGGNFHADRIVVAGDSAGGLLAAAVAARSRHVDGAPQVSLQCLVYPALDPEMGSASHRELAEGYGLTGSAMRWFYDAYRPGPGFSPIELEDLSGLPPAVIATAGYDLLKDDGLGYADRLRDAGVAVTSLHFDGLIHGFLGMAGTSTAAAGAFAATVGAVRGML